MSLPIQSVPNGCSAEGLRFLEPKSVFKESSFIVILENTIVSSKSDVRPIISRVFCLRFSPRNTPLLAVTTAVLIIQPPL
jgi:hypothetical protein